jgi:DNA-binding transcriptional MerR regulator
MDNLLPPDETGEDDSAPKKYYFTMGEVCEMFGVAPSLVRYWHSEFPEIKPLKNRKGNRLFRPQDVETIKIIYHLLKERGFTIQGAKDYIKDQKKISKTDFEVLDTLKKIRAKLVEMKDDLK